MGVAKYGNGTSNIYWQTEDMSVLTSVKDTSDGTTVQLPNNETTSETMSQRGLVVPSEVLRYFPCSGSMVRFRSLESLRTFGREDYKCSGPHAVANSHAAG